MLYSSSVLLLLYSSVSSSSSSPLYFKLSIPYLAAFVHAVRSTKATERNDQSSRSHAVARLRFLGADDDSEAGELMLVDLAGSERNEDTMSGRDASTTAETCAINASLMTLKVPFFDLRRGKRA